MRRVSVHQLARDVGATGGPRGARWWGAVLLALAPMLALAAWQWRIGPLLAIDDWGHYLLHAQRLLDARAYGDTGYLFSPRNPWVGPPSQPPGFPLTLAPLLATFGPALATFRLLMVACAIAFCLLAARALGDGDDRRLVPAVVLLLGVGLEAAYVSNVPLSDVGFSALVWTVVMLADGGAGRWSVARTAGITLAGVGALAYRLAGAPLVPAMWLVAWMRRRELGWRAAVPATVWTLCAALLQLRARDTSAFLGAIPREPFALSRWVLDTMVEYPRAVTAWLLRPFPGDLPNEAWHVVAVLVALLGGVAWAWRARRRFALAFALCYLPVLFVFGGVEARYLMPLAPLLLYALLDGARRLLVALPLTIEATRATRVVVVGASAVALLATARQVVRPAPAQLHAQPGFAAMLADARARAAREAVRAISCSPRVFTWETGIPTMGPIEATPDETVAELARQGVTLAVLGEPCHWMDEMRSLRAAVAARPDVFVEAARHGIYTLYRVNAGGVAP